MLRFTFRQLEYFVAVGDAGSITAAAEKVRVSAPSISAAITQLEREFGLPLFVRQHAQGLSLTQAGKRLLAQARLVLHEAGAMTEIAGDISGTVRGPLAVGCMLTFAQVVLPSLRRRFEQVHPTVRISQYELDQAEIFGGLRKATLDVALSYDLDLPGDLTFEPLADLPPFAVLPQGHPLARRDSLTIEELQPFPMVLLDLPYSTEYFMSFFAKAGTHPIIAERTRDMAVMRSMVANGYGYSIANIRPLSDRSPDGKPLCFVPLIEDARPMRMGLLMVTGAESARGIRAFVDHCRAVAAEGTLFGTPQAGAAGDA
nr:LysR family transcriptional regulator [Actibacterium ureilyticum]